MYRTLGILVLLCLGVATSKADPLTITGGTLVFNQNEPNSFTLTGPGTVINGLNSNLSFVMGGTVLVVGGQQVTNLRLQPLNSQDSELVPSFPITVAGVTYSSGNLIVLQLSADAVSFVVPVAANGFTVTAPLTMTGGVLGFNSPGFMDQLFSHTLSGQGTQVFTFRACLACNDPRGTLYALESWVGTFGAVAPGVTVQAVPEPASIFLLVTSATALSWMRRRNSRKG